MPGAGLIAYRKTDPALDTRGKPGSKTEAEVAEAEAKVKAVLARINNPKGSITLAQAKAAQRTMVCAHCGGKLMIEADTQYSGRLQCLLCSRVVKEVRLDTSCQVGQN